MKRKVVISAMGIATSLGDNCSDIFERCLNGECGVKVISNSKLKNDFCNYAGIIDYIDTAKVNVQGKNLLNRGNKLLVYSLVKAVENISGEEKIISDNDGLFIGNSLNVIDSSVLKVIIENCRSENGLDLALMGNILNRTSPISGLKLLPTAPSHTIAKHLDMHGNGNLDYTGRTSGIVNLFLAYNEVTNGRMDRAFVGSAFSAFEEYEFFELCKKGMMRKVVSSDNDSELIQPFEKNHNGTIYAEGSVILFVETEESANKNGRDIICYIDGGAVNTYPGNNIGDLAENGFINVMNNACISSNIDFSDVDHVFTNANSYPQWDDAELSALTHMSLKHIFRIVNTKYTIGDTDSASGLIDCAIAAYSLKNNVEFPQKKDMIFDNNVDKKVIESFKSQGQNNRVIINSAGEYGNYCSIVLSKSGE